jgi:hypothetical protein
LKGQSLTLTSAQIHNFGALIECIPILVAIMLSIHESENVSPKEFQRL